MDNCCFNRPYDDWRNDKVRMEAEAILAILFLCENGRCELCGSSALLDEIGNATDFVKKQKVLLLYQRAVFHIELTADIVSRAEEIAGMGVAPYDSLHLASAEAGRVDAFLTTDRKLIRAASRTNVTIKVMNPLIWLAEALYE